MISVNGTRKPKFVIDHDVHLKIEFDTAVDLGEFILHYMPKDETGRADHPPIFELGRRLVGLNSYNED